MARFQKLISIPEQWLSHGMRIGLGFAVVLLFVLHGAHLISLPMVNSLEGELYDMRLRATMPDTVNPQVVIIDIDEKSLKEEGRWPWSRARLADLLDRLFDTYKVSVVGMDVVYAEPESQTSLRQLERMLRQKDAQAAAAEAMLAKLKPMLDGDRKFARAMKGRNVVLGYYFKADDNKDAENLSGKLPQPACDLTQAIAQGLQPQMEIGYGANLAALQDAAAGGGHFIPNVDADGIIRSVPLLVTFQGQCYESLSMAILRRVLDAKQIEVVHGDRWSRHSLKVGNVTVPVMRDGSVFVPYRGYQGSFTYISAVDVLEKRVDPALLENTVALLGTTAAGLLDHRSTPVSSTYAGVEVHANMVAGMLDGSIRKAPTAIPGLESWLLLIFGVAVAILLGRATPLQVVWMSLLLGGVVFVLNFVLWAGFAVVMPLASFLLMTGSLFVLNMSYGFLAEERTKRLYKDRFGQYVSPEVIEEMIANPQMLESMEGTSRNMTVLFSDIRNFTTISEGMEPRQLMRMMNEYLTPMTQLIIDKNKYKGTIDKYIGDAIMAFWGAPLFDDNHAKHGVLAALEMQKLAAELTEKFKLEGWPQIRIGVGLNTGSMAVGNMGSSFRRAYTVLGDPVNLAARLEGLTKEYGVGILVSETTMEHAPGIVYRELDRVRVKGKGQAVAIYEPLGLAEDVPGEKIANADLFHQALQHYRAQHWDEAEAILRKLPAEDHVLVELYLERVAEMRAHPPGAEWDGVTTFKTK